MKYFVWDYTENEWLKKERDIGFEEVVFHIENGDISDIVEHPNKGKYGDQRMFIVAINDYVCLVPFVESDHEVFLKTIIPSRKATRQYLGGE